MTLETHKMIGGIGAILLVIGILPISYISILELVGAILILVSLYGLAGHFGEPGIFKNALYGIIAGIIGVVVAVAIAFTVVLANITEFICQIYPGWNGDWSSLSGMTPDPSLFTSANFDMSTIFSLLLAFVAVLVIIWISAIITSIFIRRSFNQVSSKSNVGLFGTAGLLLLIGACLTIILIGFLIMWVAALLLAIAFFQLKTSESMYPPQPSQY